MSSLRGRPTYETILCVFALQFQPLLKLINTPPFNKGVNLRRSFLKLKYDLLPKCTSATVGVAKTKSRKAEPKTETREAGDP